MTLPASGPISMSQVAAEVGLSASGVNLNHTWIRQLAQQLSGAISMSSLRGKTGNFTGNIASNTANTISFGNAPWFGGTLNDCGTASSFSELFFNSAPSYSGNIIVINNTTGVSMVFSQINSTTWQFAGTPPPLISNGATASYSVFPHT